MWPQRPLLSACTFEAEPFVDEILGENVAPHQEVPVGVEGVEHLLERAGRLLHRAVLAFVKVLVDRSRRLDLVDDAVQAGHEARGEREVRVARRVGRAELEAPGLGFVEVRRDAYACRTVAL